MSSIGCADESAPPAPGERALPRLFRSSACKFVIKWKAEPPSTQTRVAAWTLSSRREDSARCYCIWTYMSRLYADPQAGVHMRTSGADLDESAASTSSEARKRNQSLYARPGQLAVFRRAQLQTRHPRGGKLWAPRERRQRPDRSGSGQHHSRRDGQIVSPSRKGVDLFQITYGTTRVAISRRVIQARPERPPGREGKGRKSRRTAANVLEMER